MHDIRVPLSDSAFAFVEAQVANGGFTGPEEYITVLVEAAQKVATPSDLEQLLLDGLDSGEPIEVTDDWFEAKKREWTAKHAAKQPSCGD